MKYLNRPSFIEQRASSSSSSRKKKEKKRKEKKKSSLHPPKPKTSLKLIHLQDCIRPCLLLLFSHPSMDTLHTYIQEYSSPTYMFCELTHTTSTSRATWNAQKERKKLIVIVYRNQQRIITASAPKSYISKNLDNTKHKTQHTHGSWLMAPGL